MRCRGIGAVKHLMLGGAWFRVWCKPDDEPNSVVDPAEATCEECLYAAWQYGGRCRDRLKHLRIPLEADEVDPFADVPMGEPVQVLPKPSEAVGDFDQDGRLDVAAISDRRKP